MSHARGMPVMCVENAATPSSTFGEVGAHNMLPKRASFTRILSKFQRSRTLESAAANGGTARDEDRLANLQRKRSAREERARPWAGALANKKKNRARLMRRNAFSQNVMLDVESLRAHILVRSVLSILALRRARTRRAPFHSEFIFGAVDHMFFEHAA